MTPSNKIYVYIYMSLFKLCWTDSRESSGPKPQMSILLSYLKTRMYVVRMYSLRSICVYRYILCVNYVYTQRERNKKNKWV